MATNVARMLAKIGKNENEMTFFGTLIDRTSRRRSDPTGTCHIELTRGKDDSRRKTLETTCKNYLQEKISFLSCLWW